MRSRFAMWMLLVAVPLAACGGDDGTGLSGDPLTEDEAAALAQYLIGRGMEAGFAEFEESIQSSAPARVPIDLQDSFSKTMPCELGGTIEVVGSFQASGNTDTEVTIDFSVTQNHEGCTVIPEDSEVQFTLDVNAGVTSEFSVTVNPSTDAADASGSIEGGVDWATADGRDGSCPVDMSYEVTVSGDGGTGSATVNGDACGVQLSRSLTVGSGI